MKKRALISVSDKQGIVEVARALVQADVEIISTGNTQKVLKEHGIQSMGIEEVTQMKEMFGGRLKTLSPYVFGGILYRRQDEMDVQDARVEGIFPIDYVIVNLYPFADTIAKPDCTFAQAIEQIDIGGPSLLRAAAKNHSSVTVVCCAEDYPELIDQLKSHKETTPMFRRLMAKKVFSLTASYDAMIARYLSEDDFEDVLNLSYIKQDTLRYGENPHQKAAFYTPVNKDPYSLASAKQLAGKQLSYNNYLDTSSALAIVNEFSQPCVVAVKHTNPCGVALGQHIEEAFDKAYQSDPVSIFGGIVALNRPVTFEVAKKLSDIFLEVILAPSFEPQAFDLLSKKKNLRLLQLPLKNEMVSDVSMVTVSGGLLLQQIDQLSLRKEDCQTVTKRDVNPELWEEIDFAYRIVKHVKSNAIVVTKELATVGIGCGQSNRIGAARLALEQASFKAKGAVLASDAFFPMGDTVELAASYGIDTIVQPGGSLKDQDSIEAADHAHIAMIFTNIRHFKH